MKKTKAERFLEALGEIDEKYIEEAREKTMKKKFNFKPIIAVAACAAFALAAIPVANHFANNNFVDGGTTAGTVAPVPGDEVNFTVYESSVHAGEQPGTHKIELELNKARDPYVDENKIGTSKTITLLGKTWTGEYKETLNESDYTAPTIRYTGTSNGKNITFMVNEETGKCEYFSFNRLSETDSVKLTRGELYGIAYKNFLEGGYTDDPENYTLSSEADNGLLGYTFKFSRFVNGIETFEYVTITMKHSGEFYCYMGYHIGEMKNVDLSNINMDKFYAAIEAKFKTIYGNDYAGFEKDGAVYTKLRNGTYIFDCKIYADVKDAEGKIVKDSCFFTVTMD
ncbi:MAG: hypothetical protein IJX27_01390 [Clostridia bacterium]|nr:hypothetical protein [Clostridia bacterium]